MLKTAKVVRGVFLSLVFFTLTPLTIGVGLISLLALQESAVLKDTTEGRNLVTYPKSGISVYASLPGIVPSLSVEIASSDGRAELIKKYLLRYDSPMAPYAEEIVRVADNYEVDWRLATAIAQQESNLGKRMPSYDCNNAWGYGIHSKGTLCFDTWEEGIETVTRGIREDYLNLGYKTPEEIMAKYTPLSSGSWSQGVGKFMDDIVN